MERWNTRRAANLQNYLPRLLERLGIDEATITAKIHAGRVVGVDATLRGSRRITFTLRSIETRVRRLLAGLDVQFGRVRIDVAGSEIVKLEIVRHVRPRIDGLDAVAGLFGERE